MSSERDALAIGVSRVAGIVAGVLITFVLGIFIFPQSNSEAVKWGNGGGRGGGRAGRRM